MRNKKGLLKELEVLIDEQKETGDFYEEELKKENNLATKNRFYFSRINQYKLLVKKTKIKLEHLLSKFDVDNSSFKFLLAGMGYYKKELRKLREDLTEYSNKLGEYTEKYEAFSKPKERMPTYSLR